jgi:hypothetical protein
VKNQQDHIEATHTMQSAQDQQNISSQQVAHALGTGINQMVTAWTDASQQVVSLFQNSVSTLNETLVNVMTSRNREHSFGRQFEADRAWLACRTSLEGDGLRRAELDALAARNAAANRLYDHRMSCPLCRLPLSKTGVLRTGP